MDDDKVLIVNWTKQSTILTVQKYSLRHGKLFETIVEMPAETSSWGISALQVNDTLMLVYAQMYRARTRPSPRDPPVISTTLSRSE